jgi:ribonuclease III
VTDALARLAQRLQYRFQNEELIEQALTHRSAGARNNERLEFLGDALINFVIGEALYAARPLAAEGDLSRWRASLVCEESLVRVAEPLELGDVLKLGPGELKSGGFRRSSIIADTLEALVGAIHLDGGFSAARASCMHLYEHALAQLPESAALKDAKTRLQELLQGQHRPLPRYEVVEESGPPHRREFHVRCALADAALTADARAPSRRAAEQLAADEMLAMLGAVNA